MKKPRQRRLRGTTTYGDPMDTLEYQIWAQKGAMRQAEEHMRELARYAELRNAIAAFIAFHPTPNIAAWMFSRHLGDSTPE